METRVCEAKAEMTKVQLELNLQIAELQLKVQPSSPLEDREQRARAIQTRLEEIRQAVQNFAMLEESFAVLTSLQEDPNTQRLETEA